MDDGIGVGNRQSHRDAIAAPSHSGVFLDRRAPLVLTAALLGVSLSGPLVRLSHAHPLAIASWRLA